MATAQNRPSGLDILNEPLPPNTDSKLKTISTFPTLHLDDRPQARAVERHVMFGWSGFCRTIRTIAALSIFTDSASALIHVFSVCIACRYCCLDCYKASRATHAVGGRWANAACLDGLITGCRGLLGSLWPANSWHFSGKS